MDVFCGAGTIVIEAAQIACHRPPGLQRRFGIERLSIHSRSSGSKVQDEAEAAMERRCRSAGEAPLRIAASDIDPQAVAMARGNLQRAGLPHDRVEFNVCECRRRPAALARAGRPGLEPALQRADQHRHADLARIRRDLAQPLRRLAGAAAHQRPGPAGQLGLRERRKTPLFNGQIECRLFEFEMRRRDGAARSPPTIDTSRSDVEERDG